MQVVKKEGDEELLSLLASHQFLPTIQKQLIQSIRDKQVDLSLWESYVRLVNEQVKL